MGSTVTLRVSCLVAVLLACTGCGGSSDPLVGKWKSQFRQDTVEFTRDGKVINTEQIPGLKTAPWVARYSRVSEDAIEVTMDQELLAESIKKSGAEMAPIPSWGPGVTEKKKVFQVKAVVAKTKSPNELELQYVEDDGRIGGFAFFIRQ